MLCVDDCVCLPGAPLSPGVRFLIASIFVSVHFSISDFTAVFYSQFPEQVLTNAAAQCPEVPVLDSSVIVGHH